jgi:hypothetical protein
VRPPGTLGRFDADPVIAGRPTTSEEEMTVIRVDPASVRAYGTQAQGIFDNMHAELVTLVNDVVAVRFFGPNAVAFKTDAGKVAADFANKLNLDMGAMADAVRTSTSNIAASLGGAPVTIQLDSKTITPPSPETVDYVDVDTSALESLVPVVTNHFTVLRNGLKDNMGKLQATDWEGNAKTAAVDAVQGFTTAAQAKCDAAEQSITNYITKQIEAVTTADR